MKVGELIQELSKLDPDLDILFAKSNWATELSVGAELVSGYSIGHSKKHNVFGVRPPLFVDHKAAHRVCEGGETYLDFRSRHIRPAVYLRSVEPDFDKAYDKHQSKEARKNRAFEVVQPELLQ